jgi:regulator of replication initiation timing
VPDGDLQHQLTELRAELQRNIDARADLTRENAALRARLRELEELFLPGWKVSDPPSKRRVV